MRSRRVVRVVVLIATVAGVLPWQATPALAFVEGASDNYFGTGAGAGDTGVNAGDHDNSFFGGNAGNANTTGSFNAFFGGNAGNANTTGFANSFFGSNAGQANSEGTSNAFFGAFAGSSTTTASNNAFFGREAGTLNSTGESNSFFGAFAGQENTAGVSNAFFGVNGGLNNTTGGNNAFFGRETGFSNTTESGNSFLGALANGAAGVTNATAVGHRAQVSGVNRLVLGSIAGVNGATANVSVGIGTPSPAEPLHVRRNDGTAKVLVQEASPTLLGRELFQLTNNGAARFRVSNSSNGATWDFQSSSGGGSFVIDRVGGPASLDFEVQPDGDLVVRGSATATSFISSSDRNLKTDITPAKASKLMSLLRQLHISTWRFKNEPKGTVNLGPMAQDFHRLFGMGTDTTIDVRDLAALALVAAQALDKQALQQQEVNERLQHQIDVLRNTMTETAR